MSDRQNRAPGREEKITMRMSAAEKADLLAEAAAHGLTLQQLCELRVLGAAKPKRRTGRQPRTCDRQAELIAS